MKKRYKMIALALLASTPIIIAFTSFIIQPDALHYTEAHKVISYNHHNLDPVEQIVASQHAGHLI